MPLYFHFYNYTGYFFAEFSSSPIGAVFKAHCAYQNLLVQWLHGSFLPRILKQTYKNISLSFQIPMNRWDFRLLGFGTAFLPQTVLGSTGHPHSSLVKSLQLFDKPCQSCFKLQPKVDTLLNPLRIIYKVVSLQPVVRAYR